MHPGMQESRCFYTSKSNIIGPNSKYFEQVLTGIFALIFEILKLTAQKHDVDRHF